MLINLRKVSLKQKGFTLVELMTVIIILGIILGIGVPKYLRIQSQAEWNADAALIKGFAKAAEMYVVKKDIDLSANNIVSLDVLVTEKVIDGEITLNRKNNGSDVSIKNDDPLTKISDYCSKGINFEFDAVIGNVTNLDGLIVKLIGNSVY